MRYFGYENQSEYGAPAVGPYDRALRRGGTAANPMRTAVTGATHKFLNFFGAVVTRPALNTFVYTNGGYGGIYPMDEQPLLSKPKPWKDPTLGKP